MKQLEVHQLSVDELRQIIIESYKQAIKELDNSHSQRAYLTRKEAAKLLKISLPTLNNLRKSGTLRAYYIDSNLRYKLSDIEALFNDDNPKRPGRREWK